jgi:hypothetical protein
MLRLISQSSTHLFGKPNLRQRQIKNQRESIVTLNLQHPIPNKGRLKSTLLEVSCYVYAFAKFQECTSSPNLYQIKALIFLIKPKLGETCSQG